jgi:hypothetical protein
MSVTTITWDSAVREPQHVLHHIRVLPRCFQTTAAVVNETRTIEGPDRGRTRGHLKARASCNLPLRMELLRSTMVLYLAGKYDEAMQIGDFLG